MRHKTKRTIPLIGVMVVLFAICCTDQSEKAASTDNRVWNDWKQEQVAPEALADWRLLGKGSVSLGMNGQVTVQETDESQGVMFVSPTYYKGDVVVRYQALALTPATVFVTMLAATDRGAERLTAPDDYDGGMVFWTGEAANYFFAYKNAPHGATPFIAKNPGFEIKASAAAQDGMVAGIYYDVEVGKQGAKCWLAIDRRTVVEWEDDEPIDGGHVAFRLRGTAGLAAVGSIKALTIYSR